MTLGIADAVPAGFRADRSARLWPVSCAWRKDVECCLQIVEKGDVRVIRIAGCLSSAHVPDLLTACGEATGRVRVDLSDLLSIDPIAIDALRRVREAGAELVGAPRYMQFKLDSRVKSGKR